MMKKVRDFENRALATWEGGKTPRYSSPAARLTSPKCRKGMEVDVISTLLSSVLLVAGVFYFGFRRFRPLLAIMHVLLLCCIVAVAAGGVIFHALNGITIGFCSILVGLGVDFGMLLYGSYQTERHAGKDHEARWPGRSGNLERVSSSGATTGAGFLALALSDCSGFSQLGVLIAIGIAARGISHDDGLFCVHGAETFAAQARLAVRRNEKIRRMGFPHAAPHHARHRHPSARLEYLRFRASGKTGIPSRSEIPRTQGQQGRVRLAHHLVQNDRRRY